MERCDVCGFVWDRVARPEVGPRVRAGAAAVAAILRAAPGWVSARPSLHRWSAVEYGAHVRDVLLVLRDRLVVGLVEDEPTVVPMYRDERVGLGLYRTETAGEVADELETAARLLARLFDAVEPAALVRPVRYNYPAPARRSLLWLGQNAVHEVEHHRHDIDENLWLVAATGRRDAGPA